MGGIAGLAGAPQAHSPAPSGLARIWGDGTEEGPEAAVVPGKWRRQRRRHKTQEGQRLVPPDSGRAPPPCSASRGFPLVPRTPWGTSHCSLPVQTGQRGGSLAKATHLVARREGFQASRETSALTLQVHKERLHTEKQRQAAATRVLYSEQSSQDAREEPEEPAGERPGARRGTTVSLINRVELNYSLNFTRV